MADACYLISDSTSAVTSNSDTWISSTNCWRSSGTWRRPTRPQHGDVAETPAASRNDSGDRPAGLLLVVPAQLLPRHPGGGRSRCSGGIRRHRQTRPGRGDAPPAPAHPRAETTLRDTRGDGRRSAPGARRGPERATGRVRACGVSRADSGVDTASTGHRHRQTGSAVRLPLSSAARGPARGRRRP